MVTDLDHDQDSDTTAQLPASLIEENDDHYLSGMEPTTRLEFGNGRRQQPAPPIARRPPEPVEEVQEEEHTGLIPTTTQSTGRSNLSRRLDGI